MAIQLKTQIGTAVTADFEDNTWTFEMPDEFNVTAGNFAILPLEAYNKLMTAAKGIRNSMKVHPDCQENSEFEAMVDRIDEALNNL